MIKNLLNKIKTWVVGVPKQEQHTFVYCSCGNEMCSDGSFVSDTYEEDGNHVRYKCAVCKEESDWNFDIAPVPIKRRYRRDRYAEFERDPECQIVDTRTGEVLKGYGERHFNA